MKEKTFERVKKKIYGNYVTEFNDVTDISRMFMSDYFKGINSFDYVDAYKDVTIEYAKNVLDKHFDFSKMAVSIVENKK